MKKYLVGLAALLLVLGIVSGCGVQSSTTYYYYSPSWTRAGTIIFIGAIESVDKDILGSQLSSSYAEYVKTIYPTGTDESSVLFDATDAPPYAMTCSPASDYVAYGDDLMSGKYRKLVIRNISSGTHSGVELLELIFSPGIRAFDWSNDGSKLVYCTSAEVRTINNDGSNDTLVTTEANLEFVAWQYGDRIAFVRASGTNKLLSLIYPDGSGRLDLAAAASVDLPQISATNTNEVYGVVGSAYKKVNVNSSTVTDIVATGFSGVLPRLGPDGKTLVYSKSGESSGIYVIDVTAATPTETEVLK
jgi:Tol biopolymer transport system component